MTVDEILATGRYTDKRGREWASLGEAWVLLDPWRWANKPKRETMTEPEMRLLIERDMHRDECPTLGLCPAHPVPLVIVDGRSFDVFTTWPATFRGSYVTSGSAMDAARALAVLGE